MDGLLADFCRAFLSVEGGCECAFDMGTFLFYWVLCYGEAWVSFREHWVEWA